MRSSDGSEGFPGELFAARLDRALEALGGGAMVLPAAPLLFRTGDSELPYRPDSELFYLTGFSEPGAVLVLRGFAEAARVVLFARPRSPKEELWSGPRLGPEGAKELPGVDEARPATDLASDLPELLDGADRVHFRLGSHPEVEALVVRALRKARARGAREGKGPRGVVDPGEILDEFRLRKSPEEVGVLREAGRITALGIRRAMEAARPGAGEWELEALVESTFRLEGAMGPAFATIVGSGPNACVLHYVANRRRTEEGDLVLLDAGAEVRMYAGDATRTFPVSGRFTPEQRAVYQVVEEARARAVETVRPGVTVKQVHAAALGVLVDGLLEMGVLEGDGEELIEEEAYKPFFPHRTSHWVGLNTHDPGDYARAGESRVLEAGMVLTVEPGLYFRPEGEVPEDQDAGSAASAPGAAPFRGIGIRIEDTVLVTDGGSEILTADLPSDPGAVEGLVGTRG
jgi:Xaa-Pro aminopeptidase